MELIFVGGYSQSGKTTLLKGLLDLGEAVVSTSQVLDGLLVSKLKTEGRKESIEVLTQLIRDKDDVSLGFNARQAKIDMAECIIVPNLGRGALIRATLAKRPSTAELVFFETIGGEELLLALEEAFSLGYRTFSAINLRREGEIKGCDIRKLIPIQCPMPGQNWRVFGELWPVMQDPVSIATFLGGKK